MQYLSCQHFYYRIDMFTDTHCHVLNDIYPLPEIIIATLEKNNIKRIIVNGYNLKTNKDVLNLINKYENVYGALGVHPDNIEEKEECLKLIEANISHPKILAIGEIGLDYYHNSTNKKEQIALLTQELELAQKHNLPVIIHNRNATEDLITILKKYHCKGIIHCFNGSLETAKIFIKLGFYLGINGIITFKNCKLKEVTAQLPATSLLLETDCPYITPEPLRGIPNEPMYLKYTAQVLAQSLKIEVSELASILEENFQNLFNPKSNKQTK